MKKKPTIIILVILLLFICTLSVCIGYYWGTNSYEENPTSCDCTKVPPTETGNNVACLKAEEVDSYTGKFISYQNRLRSGTSEAAASNKIVSGGIFSKSEMMAIINSLAPGVEYFSFKFGMETDEEVGTGTEEQPFGQTFLIFEGGMNNHCNDNQINEWHPGEKLVLRSFGYCPTRCGGPGITD